MEELSKQERRRLRRAHRRERRSRSGSAAWHASAGSDASADDRYEDARRLAERKAALTGEAIKLGAIVTLLLIFVWPLGLLVLLVCGSRTLREFHDLVLEPKIRRRFVDHEISNPVHPTWDEQRRELQGDHARSLERLSASIAHEIRNPVTAAKSLVQQMGETPTAKENVEYARVALEELARVERSVSHLLRFARDEEIGLRELCLADVVESALETFRERVARGGVDLHQRIDSEGRMLGDPEKLRRVVINLIGNALDALDQSGTESPALSVQMGENLAGTEVWLQIRDNGPGIDHEVLSKMWSPFYTSKANGTGLGLAIVKRLVDAHQGSIEVDAEPGDGASFLVTFPRSSAERGEGP